MPAKELAVYGDTRARVATVQAWTHLSFLQAISPSIADFFKCIFKIVTPANNAVNERPFSLA